MARDDDRDDVGIPAERLVEYLAAVDAWQAQIGDEDVEGKIVEPGNRLFARAGLLNLKRLFGQPLRDDLTEWGFVVNQ
jgi:hypothetical protein